MTERSKDRSADALVKDVLESPTILADLKADPANTLKQVAKDVTARIPSVLESDPVIFRAIIGTLCIVVLTGSTGIMVMAALAQYDIKIPESMSALLFTALGALTALLKPPTKG